MLGNFYPSHSGIFLPQLKSPAENSNKRSCSGRYFTDSTHDGGVDDDDDDDGDEST